MSGERKDKPEDAMTPVDDVRVVRDSLHDEFRGDLRKLAAHSRAVTEQQRARLDLKLVPLPSIRRTGTSD